MYMYVHSAWKGHPRNDLYRVGWDAKLYSLTHSFTNWVKVFSCLIWLIRQQDASGLYVKNLL